MRYLILVLVLSLPFSACERVNPPVSQHDAGTVQPPDDAGSATDGGTGLDARTPRPGAGPLNPDLTIDCVETAWRLTRDDAGRVTNRSVLATAAWPIDEPLPAETWLCYSNPFLYFDCDNCEVEGERPSIKCSHLNLPIDSNGQYKIVCSVWTEEDPDGDGVFVGKPDVYDGMYLAIIR